jgi:hypothetical protein
VGFVSTAIVAATATIKHKELLIACKADLNTVYCKTEFVVGKITFIPLSLSLVSLMKIQVQY